MDADGERSRKSIFLPDDYFLYGRVYVYRRKRVMELGSLPSGRDFRVKCCKIGKRSAI
jgi:hypothetical protein